jgi:phosphosulfolactate phosphohydrolase-like enzyme
MMAARDLDDEVVFAAQENVFETVPEFMNGRVRRAHIA